MLRERPWNFFLMIIIYSIAIPDGASQEVSIYFDVQGATNVTYNIFDNTTGAAVFPYDVTLIHGVNLATHFLYHGQFELAVVAHGDVSSGTIYDSLSQVIGSWSSDVAIDFVRFAVSDGCPDEYECASGSCIDSKCSCPEGLGGYDCSNLSLETEVLSASHEIFIALRSVEMQQVWMTIYDTMTGAAMGYWSVSLDRDAVATMVLPAGLYEAEIGAVNEGGYPLLGGIWDYETGAVLADFETAPPPSEESAYFTFEVGYGCGISYTCANNGTCVEGTCVCPQGFSGFACLLGVGVCPDYFNCQNGVCSDGSCLCLEGYWGTDCSTRSVNCSLYGCDPHGTCDEDGTCLCDEGFSGYSCHEGIGICDVDYTCLNDALCINGTCDCPVGYVGDVCDIAYGCPDQYNCENGTCVNFQCKCDVGYTGDFCDVSLCDGCAYDCVNGTCVVPETTEAPYGECDVDYTCKNWGECVSGECVCSGTSHGTRCEWGVGMCNVSDPLSCGDHGVCRSGGLCLCDTGYGGIACDRELGDNEVFVLITKPHDWGGNCNPLSWECDFMTALDSTLTGQETTIWLSEDVYTISSVTLGTVSLDIGSDVLESEMPESLLLQSMPDTTYRVINIVGDETLPGLPTLFSNVDVITTVGLRVVLNIENVRMEGPFGETAEFDDDTISMGLQIRGGDVVLRNCELVGFQMMDQDGAAIVLRSGTLVVEQSLFLHNRAGLESLGECVDFVDCTLQMNVGGRGGALALIDGDAEIYNSRFENNVADAFGAAVFVGEVSAILHNCSFTGHVPGKPFVETGVVDNRPFSTVYVLHGGEITTCQFRQNSIVSVFSQGSVVVEDTVFEENTADVAAVVILGGQTDIRSSTFRENTASEAGGIFCDAFATLHVTDSIFSSNSAEHGGAMTFVSCESFLEGCQFLSNSASSAGDALYIPATYNTIFVTGATEILLSYFGCTGDLNQIFAERAVTVVSSGFNTDPSASNAAGAPVTGTCEVAGVADVALAADDCSVLVHLPGVNISSTVEKCGCDANVCGDYASGCVSMGSYVECECGDYFVQDEDYWTCVADNPPPLDLYVQDSTNTSVTLTWDLAVPSTDVDHYDLRIYVGQQVEGTSASVCDVAATCQPDVISTVCAANQWDYVEGSCSCIMDQVVDNARVLTGLMDGTCYKFFLAVMYQGSSAYSDYEPSEYGHTKYSKPDFVPLQIAFTVDKQQGAESGCGDNEAMDVTGCTNVTEVYLMSTGTHVLSWSFDEYASRILFDDAVENSVRETTYPFPFAVSPSGGSIAVGQYEQVKIHYYWDNQDPSDVPESFQLVFSTDSFLNGTLIMDVSVTLSATSTSHSEAISMDDVVVAGESFVVSLVARDIDAHTVSDNKAQFFVSSSVNDTLQCATSATVVAASHLGDSAFEAVYRGFETAGTHLVYVSLLTGTNNCEEITGSPISVSVVAAEAVAVRSEVSLPVASLSAGETMEVLVSARDTYGNVVSGEESSFEVEVSGPSSALLFPSAEDGESTWPYSYNYSVETVGSYTVHVKLGGSHVKSSPVSFEVVGSFPADLGVYISDASFASGAGGKIPVQILDRFSNPADCSNCVNVSSYPCEDNGLNLNSISIESSTSLGSYNVFVNATLTGDYCVWMKLLDDVSLETIDEETLSLFVFAGDSSPIMTTVDRQEDVLMESVGYELRFALTTLDRFGNIADNNDIFSVEIVSDYDGNVVEPLIQPHDGGTYAIRYSLTVTDAGYFQIHVSMNDEPLHVSPLSMFSGCPRDTYHEGRTCSECPTDGAICNSTGVYPPDIGTEQHYWRSGPDTTEFHKCLWVWENCGGNSECHACVGITSWDEEAGQDAQCNDGYVGRLCSVCAPNYQRIEGTYRCIPCPDPADNVRRVTLSAIGVLAFICYLVYAQLDDVAKAKENGADVELEEAYSIIMKILTSYIQLVTFAKNVDFDWPIEISVLLTIQSLIYNPATYLVSVDCLIGDGSQDVLYERARFSLLTPMALCIIVMSVLTLCTCCQYAYRAQIKKPPRTRVAGYVRSAEGTNAKLTEKASNSNSDSNSNSNSISAHVTSHRAKCALTLSNASSVNRNYFWTKWFSHTPSGKSQLKRTSSHAWETGEHTGETLLSEPVCTKQGENQPETAFSELLTDLRTKATLTLVIVLFLVYPDVTSELFKLVNCMELDGTSYVEANMEYECDTPEHTRALRGIFLPGFLIYTCGIPLFGFYLLRQNRENLDDVNVLARYGFLYYGYEKKYYWWELWITIRKTIVVFVTVFMTGAGVTVQGLTLMGLIVFSLTLHVYAKPFETNMLNKLEALGLVASFVTLFCGIYFFMPEVHDMHAVRSLLTVCVVLANAFTLVYFLYRLVRTYFTSETHHARVHRLSAIVQNAKQVKKLSVFGSVSAGADSPGLPGLSPALQAKFRLDNNLDDSDAAGFPLSSTSSTTHLSTPSEAQDDSPRTRSHNTSASASTTATAADDSVTSKRPSRQHQEESTSVNVGRHNQLFRLSRPENGVTASTSTSTSFPCDAPVSGTGKNNTCYQPSGTREEYEYEI
eukprot:Rmarinus@m.23774